MGGFVGYFSHDGGEQIVAERMMNAIHHRDPDYGGIHIEGNLAFGFRGLNSLVFNEDKSLAIVFDGEVYNFKELRQELTDKGHIFEADPDSVAEAGAEVLIHGYEEYGCSILNKIRGVFSLCICHLESGKLFIARDFFGVKPIFYFNNENTFVFGSELKGLLKHPAVPRELNKTALESYLTFQYPVLAETFFKGIFRLPPAHYLVWDNGSVEIFRYWEPTFDDSDDGRSLEEVVDLIDDTVAASIDAYKIGSGEIGCFLSSGVDSSYVSARSGVEKTFTVGFNFEGYNEINYARELCQHTGMKNISKVISDDEFWGILPRVQYFMDEPLADPAAVALYFACELASKEVKNVLSGEGADEFFGGYNIYHEPQDLKVLTWLPRFIRKLLGSIARAIPFNIKGKNFLIRCSEDVEQRFIGNAKLFTVRERRKILNFSSGDFSGDDFSGGSRGDFSGGDFSIDPASLTAPFYEKVRDKHDITKMQYIDINFWLWGDILLKADRMSMAHSVNLRTPLLDMDVFQVASSLPVKFKVHKRTTKYAMRLAAYRHIPQKFAEKRKLGFPVPIRIWLRQEKYYSLVKEAFNSPTAASFFNTKELMKLLNSHYRGRSDNARKLWAIYTFLVWHKVYFEDYEV